VKWFSSVAASSLAVLLGAQSAVAVMISNRDDRDHKVTIIEGDAKKDHTLKPSSALEGVCEKGCIVRLNDSENDEYELDGTEVVSIEDGYLYYDGPDAPGEPPAAGDAGRGSTPPKQ
jgi:hypothetical protein